LPTPMKPIRMFRPRCSESEQTVIVSLAAAIQGAFRGCFGIATPGKFLGATSSSIG